MYCEFCDLEFKTLSAKANHVRWRHKRTSSQKRCEFCRLLFEAPNLIQHQTKCARSKNECKTCCKLTINKFYCSKSCAAIANNEHGLIGYGAYRKNNNITKKRTYRDVCLENWPAQCAICGWDVSFDVHHIDDNHKNDEPRNLVLLCQNHHTMTRMNEHAETLRHQLLALVEQKFGVKSPVM